MCRTLRVLNAVRDYKIGLPLSYNQYAQRCIANARYLKVGPEGVIERLMNRRQHFLAVKICEYLEIPADRVYTNWACLKVYPITSLTRSEYRMKTKIPFVVQS
jgi:hypothetical protein